MTSINNGSTALYRAGYTFSLVYANNSYFGWTGTTVPDFGNVSVIDVYTHHDIITYSITYTLNGATTNNNPTTYTVATAQTALNNPVKSGYTFAAWEDSNGNIVEHIGVGMTGNIALVACWYQDYALEYHSTLQYKTVSSRYARFNYYGSSDVNVNRTYVLSTDVRKVSVVNSCVAKNLSFEAESGRDIDLDFIMMGSFVAPNNRSAIYMRDCSQLSIYPHLALNGSDTINIYVFGEMTVEGGAYSNSNQTAPLTNPTLFCSGLVAANANIYEFVPVAGGTLTFTGGE